MGWRIGKWTGNGHIPTRAHEDDAGFDLYIDLTTFNTCNDIQDFRLPIEPGEYTRIPSGISIEWPAGYWGLMIGRSSAIERGLFVNIAVIDSGYRGDLFAVVCNISARTVTVKHGERLAQIVPLPLIATAIRLDHVGQLSFTERGDAGFGSSGH